MQMQMQALSSASLTMIKRSHLAWLLMISILLLKSLQYTSADENLIHSACKDAPSKETCESVLLSDPRGILAFNRKDLALVGVDSTISTASAANKNAEYMADQYRGSEQGEALSQCAQLYLQLTANLQTVKNALLMSSYEGAYQAATDMWRIPDACDNEFATRRLSSLLKRKNKDLNHKISLCVYLTYQLIGDGHYISNIKD